MSPQKVILQKSDQNSNPSAPVNQPTSVDICNIEFGDAIKLLAQAMTAQLNQ